MQGALVTLGRSRPGEMRWRCTASAVVVVASKAPDLATAAATVKVRIQVPITVSRYTANVWPERTMAIAVILNQTN